MGDRVRRIGRVTGVPLQGKKWELDRKDVIVMKRIVLSAMAVLFAGSVLAAELPSDALGRTAWADRLPGDTIQTLFVAPYCAHQDSHELMERFDIAGHVVETASQWNVREFGISGHYWPTLLKTERRVMEDVRAGIDKDWEVLAMCVLPAWKYYPKDVRQTILAKVAEGRSFVIGGLGDGLEEDIKASGFEWEALPNLTGPFVFGGEEKADAPHYRLGKGHVTCAGFSNDLRFGYLLSASPLQADFELSAAWIGYVLCYTARPDLQRIFTGFTAADGGFAVAVSETALPDHAEARVVVRRRDSYERVFSDRVPCTPGQALTVDLPKLPAGEYQAEVVLTDSDGTTLDWAGGVFAVVSETIASAAVSTAPSTVKAGNTVTCSLSVEGDTTETQIVTRWFDHWNRELVRTDAVPFQETIKLMAPHGSLSVVNRVEVTVLSDDGPEATCSAEVLMPDSWAETDFSVLYWNTGVIDSWRERLQCNMLRRTCAATAFSNCGRTTGTARTAALSHLRTVPYTTAFHGITLDDRLLNDQWLSELEQQARDTVKAQKDFVPLGYTLGDENYVKAFVPEGRFAKSPEAWGKFQAYLKSTYQDLAALNAQWGAAYGSWEEIRFEDEQSVLSSLDNPSSWVDYRMFVNREFAQGHQRMRVAIQEESPGAAVGWDGVEQFSSYDGFDWWQLCQDMDVINVYHTYLVPGFTLKIFNGEAVQSFRPKAQLSGCWLNHADLRYGGYYVPWYLALHGWNSAWWWHATFRHPANGASTWDQQPTPVVGDMARAAKELRAGPATLLAHAEKQVDPILVHYSENNWHASTIESGIGNHANNLGHQQGFWMADSVTGRTVGAGDEVMDKAWGAVTPSGHHAAASASVHLMLRDLGYEPRTIARQEIEAGALETCGGRVLFLPFVVSLSDEEIASIRTFVENGGTVIADYRCGLRGLHGRLRETGALDDVFGIERALPGVQRGRASVTAEYRGTHYVRFESIFRETLRSGTAKVIGCHDDGSPAVFINGFGEGRAIYLNTDMHAYLDLRREGTERDMREFVRGLLRREADIFTPFLVEHEHGHPTDKIEVTRFRDKGTAYFGVMPDYTALDKRPLAVSLPFPEGHVYDVRRSEYLGQGGRRADQVEVGIPRMYAVLPYRVADVSVDGPDRAMRGDAVELQVTVRGEDDACGPHAVRITVSSPDGERPEYHRQTMYLGNGSGTYRFTPALNASPGQWTVEVTDAVSGLSASATIWIG
ncbi:MAG: hypothetical protein GY851_30780 [bacterium]|nr:hypothetical protein [bacterium]